MGQYFCQSVRKGMEHFWNFNKALQFVLILQKKLMSIFSENNIFAVTFRKCIRISPPGQHPVSAEQRGGGRRVTKPHNLPVLAAAEI